MGNLNGKRALVTGGGQGLGESIVRRLLEAGADVAIHYCSSETGAQTLKSLAQQMVAAPKYSKLTLHKRRKPTSLWRKRLDFWMVWMSW